MSNKVKVVVHTSDSSFGNAALIGSWHLQRGWSGIGYHYVILNGQLSSKIYNQAFDGHLETGRPLDDDHEVTLKEMGAHVRGNNKGTIGICLIGKSGDFTDNQINALTSLLNVLNIQFGDIDLYQHSDLDPSKPQCAGLDMDEIKKEVFG